MSNEPFVPGDQPPDTLILWVIYERPRDYPTGYVLRPQYAGRDSLVRISAEYRVAVSLDGVREHLPPGLTLLPAQPGDDPAILEVWI